MEEVDARTRGEGWDRGGGGGGGWGVVVGGRVPKALQDDVNRTTGARWADATMQLKLYEATLTIQLTLYPCNFSSTVCFLVGW